MIKLFVDTTAWCGIFDKDDDYYTKASAFLKQLTSRPYLFITSDYIFAETITLIRARLNHAKAAEFGKWLLSAESVQMIEITTAIRDAAWSLFLKYDDKDFSFADCTSFIIMKELDLRKVFAFDSHFLQMGFEMQPYNK